MKLHFGNLSCGFAEFASPDQARAVITGLNGKDLGGQPITVAEARPRKSDIKLQPAPATQA